MTVQKQLTGRATYGPRVEVGPGISPLWQFFLAPPAQESILAAGVRKAGKQAVRANPRLKRVSGVKKGK